MTTTDTSRLDELVRYHSAFQSFNDLLDAAGNYRPTLEVSNTERLAIADAYDAAQAERGDERRAHRYSHPMPSTPCPTNFPSSDPYNRKKNFFKDYSMGSTYRQFAVNSPEYKRLPRVRMNRDWATYFKGDTFVLLTTVGCGENAGYDDKNQPVIHRPVNLRVVLEGEVVPATDMQARTIPAEYADPVLTLIETVRKEQTESEKEAKTCGYKFVRSRGRIVGTSDGHGQCKPSEAAQSYIWGGSMRELRQLVEKVLAEYPDVQTVYLTGGYDGSDYFDFGDYEPWLSSWELDVWTRKDGWLFAR